MDEFLNFKNLNYFKVFSKTKTGQEYARIKTLTKFIESFGTWRQQFLSLEKELLSCGRTNSSPVNATAEINVV